MIGMLRGEVSLLDTELLLVDVNGVGYEVICHPSMSQRYLGATARPGGSIETLYIHTSTSDDGVRLYGFGSRDEQQLFRILISVDRVGPKAALGIVGALGLEGAVRAIVDKDAARIAQSPGVGRKTAERIVLDIHDKVTSRFSAYAVSAGNVHQVAVHDILRAMGFAEAEVQGCLTKLGSDPQWTAEELVRRALRELGGDKVAPVGAPS